MARKVETASNRGEEMAKMPKGQLPTLENNNPPFINSAYEEVEDDGMSILQPAGTLVTLSNGDVRHISEFCFAQIGKALQFLMDFSLDFTTVDWKNPIVLM